MGGGKWSLMVGDVLYGPQVDQLWKDELNSLDMHSATLGRILALLKLTVPQSSIPTLRSLRKLVNPARVDAMIQNQVSELLPFLSFGSSILPVNVTTLDETLRLLALDDPDIDSGQFLADEAFWATDKITMVLSRFGRRAPVFSTGSVLRKLTSVAKGEGSNTAPNYSPEAPTFLQVTFLPLVSAVPVWKGLLSTGMARGVWDAEVKSAVQFRGQGKKEVWSSLNKYLEESINKEDAVNGAKGKKRSGSEGKEEDKGTGGTVPPPPKKSKKNFSFFTSK
jgi:hypothetical protein